MEIALGITIALFFITLLVSVVTVDEVTQSHVWLVLSVLLMLFIAIFASDIAQSNGEAEGYKKGQVDALKGEYQYEMKVEQDTLYIKR